MVDYAAARLNMVECQLRTNKVTDERVLSGFLAVPRERFVPAALRGIAYVDDDLPLGHGRSLMEPMVLARLLQLAAIDDDDKVLEIGCATGYATAILSRLSAHVIALESDPRLAAEARAHLAEFGLGARLVEGKLDAGWPQDSPYDVILVNGAMAEIPPAIAGQLAEGGRIVGVTRNGHSVAGAAGEAVVVTRAEGVLSRRAVFDASTGLLPGFEPVPSFVF